jgi:hypothetical protein
MSFICKLTHEEQLIHWKEKNIHASNLSSCIQYQLQDIWLFYMGYVKICQCVLWIYPKFMALSHVYLCALIFWDMKKHIM